MIVFAIGFIAAALSSQLATPLGATATAGSMFFQKEEEEDMEIDAGTREKRRLARKRIMTQSINFVMVGIATAVIATNGEQKWT